MIANSWFYYFSSMAQTIAAASALLMALAFVRLQYLSNALHDVQRSLAEAFSKIARQDEYRRDASRHFLAEDWQKYFDAVCQLTRDSEDSFPQGGDYTASRNFVDSLIEQGRFLHATRLRLHRSLGNAFGGTVLCAGASILAIPMAQWVSPCILTWVWVTSGAILIVLLWLYYRLVLDTLKPNS